MESHSTNKIYFNIFISLLFVLIGFYLISKSGNEEKFLEIPYRLLVGSFAVIVNTAIGIKWIFILITSRK